jgi:hypothetical protein
MIGKVVSPSLAPKFQLDQSDIVIHHFVFNVTELFLDQLLVAKHVIQLGWDCVAQVEDASTGTANGQYDDACEGILTYPTPKPWL